MITLPKDRPDWIADWSIRQKTSRTLSRDEAFDYLMTVYLPHERYFDHYRTGIKKLETHPKLLIFPHQFFYSSIKKDLFVYNTSRHKFEIIGLIDLPKIIENNQQICIRGSRADGLIGPVYSDNNSKPFFNFNGVFLSE